MFQKVICLWEKYQIRCVENALSQFIDDGKYEYFIYSTADKLYQIIYLII